MREILNINEMKNLKIKLPVKLTLLTLFVILLNSCNNDEIETPEKFSDVKLPALFHSKIDNDLMSKTSTNSEFFTEDFTFNIVLENGNNFDVKFRASGLIDVEGITNLQIENDFFEKTGLSTNFLIENQNMTKALFKNKLLAKTSCWDQCKEDRRTGFGRAICRTGCVLKDIAKIAKEVAMTIAAIRLL